MSNLEELYSSEEPQSSDEISTISTLPTLRYKILWKMNTQFSTWTEKLGYPRPQGNLPMLPFLTNQKQESLLRAYFSVYGDSADHAGKEWKAY